MQLLHQTQILDNHQELLNDHLSALPGVTSGWLMVSSEGRSKYVLLLVDIIIVAGAVKASHGIQDF